MKKLTFETFIFQFIDGRLAKLNAGRGFSDIFEEEITSGGFSGGKDNFEYDYPFSRQHLIFVCISDICIFINNRFPPKHTMFYV